MYSSVWRGFTRFRIRVEGGAYRRPWLRKVLAGHDARRHADLSGDEIVDGEPDPEGETDAEIVLDLDTDEVCFDIEWEDTDAPNEAHIHAGEQGDTGDVVVDLTQGFDPDQIADDEEVEGCFEVDDHDTLQDIADHPEDYYIDLHNDNGDLRGQLAYD